jgi:serine phosphatase RsbU (regulator of sigma subunit)/FixJ family two-component response regulator
MVALHTVKMPVLVSGGGLRMGATSTRTGQNPKSVLPRALIADDQVEVLEALRLLLKGEAIQTFAVTSPAAVLEALEKHHFDIVLMDLNYARDTTSGREGLDLLTQIQNFDNTLPIVVMTGWGSVDLAVEVMRRGVRDFVQKPWENERLIKTIRTHIIEGQVFRKGRWLDAEMKAMNGHISAVGDLHAMLKQVAEHIHRALCVLNVTIFTRAPLDQAFWVTAQAGGSDEILGRLKFEPDSPLLTPMDEITPVNSEDFSNRDRVKLEQISCTLIAPFRLKGELIGFLALGEKDNGEPFDQEELRFLNLAIEGIILGIENLRSRNQQREFEEAREIQQGLLPKQIPQIPGYEIFGGWQPASAVGGDYFDALRFSETRVALCIADVSGKGMPAALLMSNLQAAVKAFASESIQPKDLCSKVNRVICSNIATNKFITFFYCLHDAEKKRLIYASAGHDAPILMRKDGSHIRLREGGAVLGVFHEWNYEQNEVEFDSGDRVLLFTDGVTEVRNSDGEEFGERRLIELFRRMRDFGARQLQQHILQTVAEFSGGEFQDDATLIAMSAD